MWLLKLLKHIGSSQYISVDSGVCAQGNTGGKSCIWCLSFLTDNTVLESSHWATLSLPLHCNLHAVFAETDFHPKVNKVLPKNWNQVSEILQTGKQ